MKKLTELPLTELIATINFYEERIEMLPWKETGGYPSLQPEDQKKMDLMNVTIGKLKMAIHLKLAEYDG